MDGFAESDYQSKRDHIESSTRIASGLLTNAVAARRPRRLGFKDFSKFIEHLDVLFDIEELIRVEIVRLDDDAPAIAVSLIVDEVRIILDIAVKFENLAGEWRRLLYTSPSPRDLSITRMPSSA